MVHRPEIEDVGSHAHSTHIHLFIAEPDEVGDGSIACNATDDILESHLALIVGVDAKLRSYPDASLTILSEGMDIVALMSQINSLKGLLPGMEQEHTFIIHAQPHIS